MISYIVDLYNTIQLRSLYRSVKMKEIIKISRKREESKRGEISKIRDIRENKLVSRIEGEGRR